MTEFVPCAKVEDDFMVTQRRCGVVLLERGVEYPGKRPSGVHSCVDEVQEENRSCANLGFRGSFAHTSDKRWFITCWNRFSFHRSCKCKVRHWFRSHCTLVLLVASWTLERYSGRPKFIFNFLRYLNTDIANDTRTDAIGTRNGVSTVMAKVAESILCTRTSSFRNYGG